MNIPTDLAHAQEELARHDAPPPPKPMFRDPDEPGSLISITKGWQQIRGWMNAAPDADREAWRAELLDLVQNDLGATLVPVTEPALARDTGKCISVKTTPTKKLSPAERKRAIKKADAELAERIEAGDISLDAAEAELAAR